MRSSSLSHPKHNQRIHHRHGLEVGGSEHDGTGKAWIRWMHKRGIKAWVIPLLLLMSTLFKFCIGLGSYSGRGTPPMFGDYEAQRHWMELTLHLPFRLWYKYDLQYWGLDYPPLTAYVSWICGVVAHQINPAWVELDKSRGIETETSKIFMRSTVIAWDMLVYVPALVMFVKTWQGNRSGRTQELALLTLLFQPALLLIDFGHFQYNSVMLGFTLLAINSFATGNDLIGTFFFVLSLGFKQMALYYAPAIGSYLLAKCLYFGVPGPGLKLFTRLGITTISSFLLLFLPFYLPPFAPSVKTILDPITRIFPFNRGLFEDKVANFWCASNIAIKWRERLGRSVLVKLSTGLTAIGFLPSVGSMLSTGWRVRLSGKTGQENQEENLETQAPFLPLLPYALLTSSFSFFLFSFQVHEKTILLPLLPMTLLLSGAPVDSSVYAWGVLVNNIGVFSMWPLLKKDGLGLQYFALLLLWNRMVGYNPLRLPSGTFVQFLSLATYTAVTALHLMEFVMDPPARYPDIYPVLNVFISTPIFILAWLWSIKCGIEVGWAAGGLGSSSTSTSSLKVRAGSLAPEETSPTITGGEGSASFQGIPQHGQRITSFGYVPKAEAGTGRRKRKSSTKSRTSSSSILG
ncbi:putative dolichyl pyrophosphate Man9GlcNAc2 alpha-1,3-glucosyltransferase [Leucoagaricus sp. SymC.cos]|nr:putative dolichyl pyrophosphate Man9GlcNAc2 alpha-1,3-glucosyltransferase [Leucoagaricus sp. SymC.cos]